MKGAGKPKQMPKNMPSPMKGTPGPADGQMNNAPGFRKGGAVKKSKKK